MDSLEVQPPPPKPYDDSKCGDIKRALKKIGCFCLGMSFSMTLFGLTLYNVIRLFLPEAPVIRRGCQCGYKFENKFVLDDVAAWPWQVAIRVNMTGMDNATEDEEEKFCAATLIHEDWLLTAADCVPYIGSVPQPDAITVNVGALNKDIWNYTAYSQERTVDQIIVHTAYERERHLNDLALLHLNNSVPESKFIQPVCLPFRNMEQDFVGESVTVTGWGTLAFNDRESENVFALEVPIISNEQCYDLHKNYAVWEDMMCSYETGRDSCQGDSGGPLVWLSPSGKSRGRWQLIGVTTFGTLCGKSGSPGVYTRVITYMDWIQQSTNATFCNPKKP